MSDYRYGPVEVHLVTFEGPEPDIATMDALTALLETKAVRLLDLVIATKDTSHQVEITELRGSAQTLGQFLEPGGLTDGLIAQEDLLELGAAMPARTSALVIALELSYAKDLAENLSKGGGQVLRSERIPAAVVNALVDLFEEPAPATRERG